MSKTTTRVFSQQYAYGDTLWIIHNKGNADTYCSCHTCGGGCGRSPKCPDFAAKGTFAIYHPGYGWRDESCVRGSVSKTFKAAKAKMEKQWRISLLRAEGHLRAQAVECREKRRLLNRRGAQAFARPRAAPNRASPRAVRVEGGVRRPGVRKPEPSKAKE